MRIVHEFRNWRVEKDVGPDSLMNEIGFLVANKQGGFFSMGIESVYRGMFVELDGKLFKVIDELRSEGEWDELVNRFWCVELRRKARFERYFMPIHSNSLVVETSGDFKMGLLLDMHEINDFREWGRHYEVSGDKDKAVIEFRKRTHRHEDESHDLEEYRVCLAVVGESLSFQKELQWQRQQYGFESRSEARIRERYVFEALSLSGTRMVFTAASSREAAVQEARHILSNISRIAEYQKKYYSFSFNEHVRFKAIALAQKCAVEGLDNLLNIQEHPGLHHSLPLNAGFYSRKFQDFDEAFCLKAAIIQREYAGVKEMLGKLLDRSMEQQGVDQDFTPVWILQRYHDLLEQLVATRQTYEYFTKEDLHILLSRLVKLGEKFKADCRMELVKADSAARARKSLQERSAEAMKAVYLMACQKLLYSLTGEEHYKGFEDQLRRHFRQEIYDHEVARLMRSDISLFRYAYLYPSLFSKQEWTIQFSGLLRELWLPWGGIRHQYTPASRQESHFWINNLAAIVLSGMDKKRFWHYVKRIIEASTNEILYSGYVGQHTESTDESFLDSRGSLGFAKSKATYIELVEALFGKEDA